MGGTVGETNIQKTKNSLFFRNLRMYDKLHSSFFPTARDWDEAIEE
jgi:hypothetical protein